VAGGEARGFHLLGTSDAEWKAPTTAFLVQGDAHEVEVGMRAKGVIASARGPAIRLAPHFYSTLDEVEVALDSLGEVLKGMA
jgi:selenocysteine lyase/cysteine desulfurase